jgi:DNA polymerase III epsilon subunit family exonuclease
MFDLSNARFAFLDLETTGLSPWFGDRICEVGIVLTEGKRIKEQVQQLVNPERPLSVGAASTNRLTDNELASAPRFADVAESVDDLLKDAVVVCHNASFDLQFLDSEFKRLGREIQIPNLIDTLLLARQYYELPSYSLNHIAEMFQFAITV